MSNNKIPLVSWHGVTPGSLNLSSAKTFEPSGLTLYSDGTDPWIFVVGDSSKVMKAKINHCRDGKPSQTSWHGPDTLSASEIPVALNDDSLKPNDLECVTFAKGNIMLGVEGDRTSSTQTTPTTPYILRFDQTNDGNGDINKVGKLTGSSWDLNGLLPRDAGTNSGMEGLTFIPNGSFPSRWSSGGYYGGVFLASTQSTAGKASVYCLAQGGGDEDTAASPVAVSSDGLASGVLTIPAPRAFTGASQDPPLISELFFDGSRGALWVLYDGGASADYLQALSLNASTGALVELWSDSLPWQGVEGMAVDGDDLYLAIDNNDDSDGIYLLSGFASRVLAA